MAYVRLKRSRGTRNYYLVEGKHFNGKVRQRVLRYLGTEASGCDTVQKAIAYWEKVLRGRRPATGTTARKIHAQLCTLRKYAGKTECRTAPHIR